MSSFNENVIASNGELMFAVDSISRDSNPSASEYLNFCNNFSNVDSAPLTGFLNTNLPDSRSGLLKSHFQSDSHNMHNFKRQPNLSSGLPCGTAVDARDASVAYMDDLFAENSNSCFLSSWNECSSNLQSRNQIDPCGNMRPQMANTHCEDSDFQLGSVSGYCAQPSSSINYNNVRSAADFVSGSSWCSASWAEQSSDRKTSEWARSLQDPTTEVDSLFPQSEFERSWCSQTLRDGGGMVSHSNVPVSSRSGQSASAAKTSNSQDHYRRRGHTSSADTSSNNPPTDENRSIDLPPGQSVNTADFDVAICLPDAIARMSFVTDPPITQQSISPSESSFLEQVLSAVDKSRLLAHQVHPGFWPVLSSQEGIPCPSVDPAVLNQKNDGYHRSANSDQHTQQDTLAAFRNSVFGYAKAPSAYGYDDGGLDSGRHPEGPGSGCLSDDQLWYYEDPQGRIQGEFSSSQMFSWLLAGRYFTSSLRIRRKCDDTFSTLYNYVQLFGRIPFAGTAQMPPILGGITPQLILLFRMHDQQSATKPPFACLDQQQLRKLSQSVAGDGNCVMDVSGGFEKNGMSSSNTAAIASQVLLPKQLTDMFASNSGSAPINFNNTVSSFLSEWISKARLDPLAVQEMVNTAGVSNFVANGLWPSPSSQAQLLAQQQQLSTQPSAEGDSTSALPDPGIDGFLRSIPQADEIVGAFSSKNSAPFQSGSYPNVDSHSPTRLRHKSTMARNVDIGASESEAKSKQNANSATTSQKPSLRHKCSPTGVKSVGMKGNCSGRQSQHAISRSGCSSCSSSECGGCGDSGTWSNEPVPFNSSFADSAPGQPPPVTAKLIKPLVPSSGVGNSTKKKEKARSRRQQEQLQQPQVKSQNGVEKSDNNGTASSSKSIKNCAMDNSILTDELNALIRWVQSSLAGIKLREQVDIPTFVELLTTIDAPYEVESMLITYLGNSPRSEQFLREFLDRRHTCWKLHRKHVEETQNDSKLKKKKKKKKNQTYQSELLVLTNNECDSYASNACSEANDSQANNTWQQIKSKTSSSRRGKKKGHQRS